MNRKYIDIHRHLDGCLTIEILKKIANLQNISLPNDEKIKELITVPNDCADLIEYLKRYDLPLQLLQTKEALEEATFLALEDCIKEGLIYVELRFAPLLHLRKGLTQEEVVESVLRGFKRSKMKANLILCMMRGKEYYEQDLDTVKVAKKYLVQDGGVVALDIAGAEQGNSIMNYQEHFDLANKLGIPFTIHAGEVDSYVSVVNALTLGARRIGHGVRSYESDELLKYLKDNQITLEMCPNSNRLTKAFSDMSKYPLKKYLDYGIKVTINVDGPGVQGTRIQDEFAVINQYFHLSHEEYLKIVNNAIDGAFTTDEVKESLRAQLN